jgi:hypothetical protein
MHAKKLELKEKLDGLYIQLEEAHLSYAKNQTIENEALVKKYDAAIDEIIDQLIDLD